MNSISPISCMWRLSAFPTELLIKPWTEKKSAISKQPLCAGSRSFPPIYIRGFNKHVVYLLSFTFYIFCLFTFFSFSFLFNSFTYYYSIVALCFIYASEMWVSHIIYSENISVIRNLDGGSQKKNTATDLATETDVNTSTSNTTTTTTTAITTTAASNNRQSLLLINNSNSSNNIN